MKPRSSATPEMVSFMMGALNGKDQRTKGVVGSGQCQPMDLLWNGLEGKFRVMLSWQIPQDLPPPYLSRRDCEEIDIFRFC